MSPNEPPVRVENSTPDEEHRYHDYRGSDVPWYVRVLWLGFWALAIYYVVGNLIPAMQRELVAP